MAIPIRRNSTGQGRPNRSERKSAASHVNTLMNGHGKPTRSPSISCFRGGGILERPVLSLRVSTFALGQNLVLLRSDGTKVLKPFLRWLVRGPLHGGTQVGKYINVGAVFDSLKCSRYSRFTAYQSHPSPNNAPSPTSLAPWTTRSNSTGA